MTVDVLAPIAGPPTSDRTIDLTRVIHAVRRRWRLMAVLIVLGGLAGFADGKLATPQYASTTTLFFSLDRGQTASELVQGSTYTEDLVQSYANVATSPAVLTPVIDDLDLQVSAKALATSIDAKAPLNTVLLDITVTRPSARQAAAIAASVAQHLPTVVTALSPANNAGDSLKVSVIAPATVPVAASSPKVHLDIAVGLLVGLLLGAAAVLVREVVGGTLNDGDAVLLVTQTPVIGTIPRSRRRRLRRAASVGGRADVARSEAYRTLRTNLDFVRRGKALSLVVTSAEAAEGKTTTVIELAAVLAEAGLKVMVIDADLRRPTIAQRLGLEGAAGLSTTLSGTVAWPDVVQSWGPAGVHVLASGLVPPNPSELLASAEMQDLLKAVAADYDVVLLDSAPLLPVTDAAVLAGRTDGALLVVNARRTSARQLRDVLGRIRSAGAPTLGIALNFTRPLSSSYYHG